jgi:hypothetical protein
VTWGTTPWGLWPWGSITPLAGPLPPPTIVGVASYPGPTAPASSPAVIDENGGTICLVVGTNFYDPITIDFLTGPGGGPYTVVAQGYVFDPRFDLTQTRCMFSAPALERGLYHVRVTTGGGSSAVLEDAFAARRFADEFKTVSVRGKFSPVWETGPRILRG